MMMLNEYFDPRIERIPDYAWTDDDSFAKGEYDKLLALAGKVREIAERSR